MNFALHLLTCTSRERCATYCAVLSDLPWRWRISPCCLTEPYRYEYSTMDLLLWPAVKSTWYCYTVLLCSLDYLGTKMLPALLFSLASILFTIALLQSYRLLGSWTHLSQEYQQERMRTDLLSVHDFLSLIFSLLSDSRPTNSFNIAATLLFSIILCWNNQIWLDSFGIHNKV